MPTKLDIMVYDGYQERPLRPSHKCRIWDSFGPVGKKMDFGNYARSIDKMWQWFGKSPVLLGTKWKRFGSIHYIHVYVYICMYVCWENEGVHFAVCYVFHKFGWMWLKRCGAVYVTGTAFFLGAVYLHTS